MHVLQVSFGWYSNIARIIKPFAKIHAIQTDQALISDKDLQFHKSFRTFRSILLGRSDTTVQVCRIFLLNSTYCCFCLLEISVGVTGHEVL